MPRKDPRKEKLREQDAAFFIRVIIAQPLLAGPAHMIGSLSSRPIVSFVTDGVPVKDIVTRRQYLALMTGRCQHLVGVAV